MQNKEILPALKLLYNRDTEFFLESISNFKRKVQIYFKPNITYLIPLVLPVIKFISPCLISTYSSYSGPPVLFSNGSILKISKICVKDHGRGSFSEILPKFHQVNAISEQPLKQKVDSVRNKTSKLQNEAQDDFLSQTFTYEVNSINSVNVSINDPIAYEECY